MVSFLENAAQLWWSWMSAMFWQVSILVIVIGAIDLLIRKWAWPQVRRALWLLVLVKLMLPPAFSLPSGIVPHFVPTVQSGFEQTVGRMLEGRTPADPQAGRDLGSGSAAADPRAPVETGQLAVASKEGSFPWLLLAMGVWIAGMVFFILLLQTRLARLRRWHREQVERRTIPEWFHDILVRSARRLNMGELPAIVFSDEVASPAVYGVFNPVLLLPAEYLSTLSHEEAEHVLLHELAHLKRGDLRWHGLTLALQIVYWFNPFLIWARRQLKHVGEICCDLTVADTLQEETPMYRQTLLKTARKLLTESPDPGLGLLGVFEDPFRLVARIRWLERGSWRHREAIVITVCCVLLVAVPCLLPMGAPEAGRAEAARIGLQDDGLELANYDRDVMSSTGKEPGLCYHLREVSRAERHFLGIRFDRKILAINETWINDDAAAYTFGGRTFIADLSRGVMIFVDHEHGTWYEGPLPVPVPESIAEDYLDDWHRMRTDGRVEATDKHRDILDCESRRYDVTSWPVAARANVSEFSVWASEDVPFDTRPFNALLESIRRLMNRTETYKLELDKVRGFQMRIAMERKRGLFTERFIDENEEIELETPPFDVFSPPDGYTRVEDISRIR